MLIKKFIILLVSFQIVYSFPEQGKWENIFNLQSAQIGISKSVYAGSKIYVQILCSAKTDDTEINIIWQLAQYLCWNDYSNNDENGSSYNAPFFVKSEPLTVPCNNDNYIPLKEYKFTEDTDDKKLPVDDKNVQKSLDDQTKPNENKSIDDSKDEKLTRISANPGVVTDKPIFTIPKDGAYRFDLQITSTKDFTATVHTEIKSMHGFLSAADWPLLPFYGAMCLVYVIFGIIWLIGLFMQSRYFVRIQFWIGGVILLGLLEKAIFYAEYQSINSSGSSVRGAVLMAEWVSCANRTLERMLVIIVSLGFGIVKPRLGPDYRIVGAGSLYFILACVESYLRVVHTKNDTSNQLLVASIPLAVLDLAICWWIFNSLVHTTRALRLRRNMVKLVLYKYFTNTLIFAIAASIIFMLFSTKTHRFALCLMEWKVLWQDEAFWHVLFSTLLLVIMILWQRCGFTQLLDSPEDEDDDIPSASNEICNTDIPSTSNEICDELSDTKNHIQLPIVSNIIQDDMVNLTPTEQAYLTRRAERLRRLEEQSAQLLQRMTESTSRTDGISNHLTNLHSRYNSTENRTQENSDEHVEETATEDENGGASDTNNEQ